MQILETVVISHQPEFVQELTALLSPERGEVLGIEVLRIKIEDDFGLLLYNLGAGENIRAEIIEHLQPHLSGLIVVRDEHPTAIENDAGSEAIIQALEKLPTVVAVRTASLESMNIKDHILAAGLYLSPNGKILFWAPDQPESQRRIWKEIWLTLQRAEKTAPAS